MLALLPSPPRKAGVEIESPRSPNWDFNVMPRLAPIDRADRRVGSAAMVNNRGHVRR